MTTLTPRGSQLLGAIQRNFHLLDEHARSHPAEVDAILTAMLGHIRSWRPQAMTLDTAPVEKVELAR